jgi:hypothetical protein
VAAAVGRRCDVSVNARFFFVCFGFARRRRGLGYNGERWLGHCNVRVNGSRSVSDDVWVNRSTWID